MSSEAALELIVDEPAPGDANMQRDLELLDRVLRGVSAGAVRLYGFSPPCLSLGRLQSEDDVDVEACARDGIDVVRRPTGGRAVLHDAEVTYSVTCEVAHPRFGGSVADSCRRIHAAVARGLLALGVTTTSRSARERLPDHGAGAAAPVPVSPDCFAEASAGELLDRFGRKLVGSAQARRAGALLQHGSILLERSGAARYLRGARGLSSSSDGLRALLGGAIDQQAIIEALAQALRSTTSC